MDRKRAHHRRDSGASLLVGGQEHDLVDLSPAGLAMRAAEELPVGASVPFALRLPGGGVVGGLAEVRWARPQGWRFAHGLEFVKIGPLARQRLRKHLDPLHFGPFEAAELVLQFAAALAILLAFREAFVRDPALVELACDYGPWALIFGSVAAGIAVVFRR